MTDETKASTEPPAGTTVQSPPDPTTGAAATIGAAAGAAATNAGGAASTDDESLFDQALASAPPDWGWLIAALVIVGAAWGVGWKIYTHFNPADFKPAANYTAFAGLFVVALAVERLLEPFSGLIVPSADSTKKTRDAAVNIAKSTGNAADKKTAVNAQAKAATAKSNRAVMMWASAAAIAMLASAGLGLFLLRSLDTASTTTTAPAATPPAGANANTPPAPSPSPSTPSTPSTPSKDPNRAIDLLLTGLVVGAGTKPLHDLVTRVQASSSSSGSGGSGSGSSGSGGGSS